jgi:hypothetical protein
VATYDGVAKLALALPEVTEGERHGNRTWFVAGKAFAPHPWHPPTATEVAREVQGWGGRSFFGSLLTTVW